MLAQAEQKPRGFNPFRFLAAAVLPRSARAGARARASVPRKRCGATAPEARPQDRRARRRRGREGCRRQAGAYRRRLHGDGPRQGFDRCLRPECQCRRKSTGATAIPAWCGRIISIGRPSCPPSSRRRSPTRCLLSSAPRTGSRSIRTPASTCSERRLDDPLRPHCRLPMRSRNGKPAIW